MAAPTSWPSYAYNNLSQPAVIVANLAAFNALPAPGLWSATPFTTPAQPPFDVGLPITDARAQQLLIENRISNQYLHVIAGPFAEDPAAIRADILANDSSVIT